MQTIEVVGAVIVNPAGEVLCALRSERMSLPGFWEFPGGKIEPGEHPRHALRREIREELGCGIAVEEPIADSVHRYPGIAVRLMTFYARIIDGEPAANEHDQLVWLPITSLDTLEWAPADVPTITALQRNKRRI